MKKIILSILVSIIFLPLAFVGQAIGNFFGGYTAMIFENWFVAKFVVEFIPYIIGGMLGGGLSAVAVSKIYKSFNMVSAMIIPSIIILATLAGNIIVPIIRENYASLDIYMTVSNAVLIISYYYFLKENKIN